MSDRRNREKIIQLDRVFLFGDKLSFRIPHEWVESDEGEDSYLYRAPGTDSGWLRVSLLTLKTVCRDPCKRLKKLFLSKKNVRIEKSTGNLVSVSEKDSEEGGEPIHLYYWRVGNVIPPDEICEAIFSYTVLSERVRDLKTIRTVQLIGELVSQAEFAPGKLVQ
jgi:hypothetical protein